MGKPVADRLRSSSADILAIWERRARTEIIATQGKDSQTVQDELSLFLNSLVKNLQSTNPLEIIAHEKAAISHGQQRSGLTDYTLIQIIEEYSLMRQVLIQILTEQGTISEFDRRTIHLAVDTAMELAANEFAKSEQSKIVLALAEAHQSNRELEQFAAVIAHDFRSPLATIAGFTEVLTEELEGAERPGAEEALDFIKNAVTRLVSLVDGVLSYARLNSEKPGFEQVDCNVAVSAAVQNLQFQLTETGGRIQFENLPTVSGELPLLTQLFQNLFSNSLKFRGDLPPVIQVSSKLDNAKWIFSVCDNGIGFDRSMKETIFGLYKKAHSISGNQGAGIGLATCRRVVELHHGTIWAEPNANGGSTFHFTLPK